MRKIDDYVQLDYNCCIGVYQVMKGNQMDIIREKKGYIIDMDGVIYHGDRLLPGVKEFVDWLYREDKKFLFLTNASGKSPKELQHKLKRMGLDVDESHFYTSALATAKFLSRQHPDCSAYVIGEPGLFNALHDVGITVSDVDPDYVVIGETSSYNYEKLCKAVCLVRDGAKLIGTNSDLTGPSEQGILPACRALVAPIELATGKSAYYVGKPNPLMMRTGLRMLGVHSEETAMIGDRMDTDIIAGIESGLDTVLVLSGVTTRETVENYPYRPRIILNGVGEIPS
jgi:NagD protein